MQLKNKLKINVSAETVLKRNLLALCTHCCVFKKSVTDLFAFDFRVPNVHCQITMDTIANYYDCLKCYM